MYAFKDEACTHSVGSSKAIQWLEATAVLPEDRHFAMVDGRWYEIDAGETERDYNENSALDSDFDFVCLDRRGVKDEFHNKWGFEACDLLGPDNELIQVKQATSSSPLSHLFSQACVAVQGLEGSVQARTRFRELVRQQGRGRELPHDFMPTKVVFGISAQEGRSRHAQHALSIRTGRPGPNGPHAAVRPIPDRHRSPRNKARLGGYLSRPASSFAIVSKPVTSGTIATTAAMPAGQRQVPQARSSMIEGGVAQLGSRTLRSLATTS